MGGGNGAKAAQKRERNAAKATGPAKSQLKANAKAMSIQCKTCFQTFMSTTKEPELKKHAEDRHSKTPADCFPEWWAANGTN